MFEQRWQPERPRWYRGGSGRPLVFLPGDRTGSRKACAVAVMEVQGAPERDRVLITARRRWAVVLGLALLFGAAVYLLAVQTRTGQALENAALRGASQVDPDLRAAALHQFHTISVTSQLAAALIVGIIGLL